MGQEDATPLDRLLAPWLAAEADEEAEQRLAELIATEIEPVIRGVIRFKLRLGTNSPDVDDLKQESVAEILSKLHGCRREPTRHPIGDVRGLAATITYRTCYRWLRRQSPQRNALRNRLQYVLTRKPHLALWQVGAKRLLGGLAVWRGRTDYASPASLEQLSEDESVRACAARVSAETGVAAFSIFLETLFTRINVPVAFEDLVGAAAALLQVSDGPVASTTEDDRGDIPDTRPNTRFDVGWQLEKRTFLERAWKEVLELPLPQRTALLLNLRDEAGRGCVELFPAVGVARLHHLATALGISLEQLAELWNQLPLDDAAIAKLLNLTRQQVINLRKKARERLTRRLRGFF